MSDHRYFESAIHTSKASDRPKSQIDVSQKLVESGLGVVYDRNNKKDWCSENGY